jgi:hypothetical protein
MKSNTTIDCQFWFVVVFKLKYSWSKQSFLFFCLGEFPTFTNGLTLTPDDNSSQVDETTVNKIPVIWGPPKRNK